MVRHVQEYFHKGYSYSLILCFLAGLHDNIVISMTATTFYGPKKKEPGAYDAN